MAFIGEYADVDRVLEVIEVVPMRPFELRLRGLGAFDDLWWVGLEKSKPLISYVKALRHALANAGIPFDRRQFLPHITLVRRAEARKQILAEIPIQAEMTVEHISLLRSDRGRNGMIYTELF